MDAKIYTELLQTPGKISPEQVQQLNEILRDHPYCKSASILYFVGLHQHNKKQFDEQLSHSMIFGDEKRLLTWVINSLEEKAIIEPPVEKEPSKEENKKKLIDKFIEEEPSIARPTGDYKYNIDLANKSSKDYDNITSETLAQIHLNQGNRKRAIEIYEKLILTYPEKSSYFAAQIEKIHKKSN